MIPQEILNPKGCDKMHGQFEEIKDYYLCCEFGLCPQCKNIQKAQAQVLLDEKKSELEFWEPYADFMDVSNEDNEKTAEIKNNLIIEGYDKIQELKEDIKVLEGVLK